MQSPILQRLPVDCLRLILKGCVDYDDQGIHNPIYLIRLRPVCRTFEYEIMSLLGVSGWIWSAKDNRALQGLLVSEDARCRVSERCAAPLGRDAAAFIARCIVLRPRASPFRWNANLFTVMTSVVERVMADLKLDSDAPERLQYIAQLCRVALPVTRVAFSREIGIWDMYTSMAQELLFPSAPHITEASFDMHVLVARVLLKDATVESKLRSIVLEKGPKALSIHNNRSKRTLFGGLLEAAIRSQNIDLVCYLISHDIDISRYRDRPPVQRRSSHRRFYDGFFLDLAVEVGNPEILGVLLQRRFDKVDPTSLVLQAACFGHAVNTKKLLDHYFPPQERLNSEYYTVKEYGTTTERSSAEYFYDFYQKTASRVFGWALMEACRHRDIACVSAILSCQFTTKAPEFVGEWNQYAVPSASSWASYNLRGLQYSDQLPVTIAVDNGDTEILKLLLDHGANPHAAPYYVKNENQLYSVTAGRTYTDKSGLSLLRVCACRGDTQMARMLLDAGLSYTTKGWLLFADQFARRTVSLGLPNERSGEFDRDARLSQVRQFWRWLADQGVFKVESLRMECDLRLEQQSSSQEWMSEVDELRLFLSQCFDTD